MTPKQITLTIAGVLMGIILLGAGWKEFFHYQVFPKRFGVVEEGMLYRSGQMHAALVERVLAENDIRVVIDLQYFEDLPNILAEQAAIEKLGLKQYRFPLNGNGTGNIESYVSAIKEIDAALGRGEATLVHCSAGTQRAGGVLAAYRTLVQGRSATQAVAEMERYDWDPIDDQDVLVYLDENITLLADRLVEEGVIPAVPAELPQFVEAAKTL